MVVVELNVLYSELVQEGRREPRWPPSWNGIYLSKRIAF